MSKLDNYITSLDEDFADSDDAIEEKIKPTVPDKKSNPEENLEETDSEDTSEETEEFDSD